MEERMKKLYFIVLALILLIASGCAEETSATLTNASESSQTPAHDKFSLWTDQTLLRGANVYQRILYLDDWDDAEVWGNGPLGPAYTQEDFNLLSEAGANFVVLSHTGLFEDLPPYDLNTEVQDNLDSYIAMAEKADLFVVIAYRTGPGRSEFTFFGIGEEEEFIKDHMNDEVWKDREAQDKWVEMWRYTASRYRYHPAVIGYELMVEPNSNGVWLDAWEPDDFYPKYSNTLYDWNQLYPRISRAIREVDNDTPILIGGLGWSAVTWLPCVKPTGDNRTIYTVHQYAPQEQYTHQVANDSGILPNEYPGKFDTNDDGEVEDFNEAWLRNLLGTVKQFKDRYHVPMAVTEYGVIRWEPGAEKFLDDEMALFEEYGLNYAIWSWQPVSREYSEIQNKMNYTLGADPDNLSEGDWDLFIMVKDYWHRNELRLSDFR
jgi:hypothetical protein